jgi:glutamyl-Q tRNA(Asp) synthetase
LSLEPTGCAIRFSNEQPVEQFEDLLQGIVTAPPGPGFADDFIIHRKDGLYAYQLAVVVDDILQGITQIVRGSDLLSTTLHQMTLYRAFGAPFVDYLHLPVAITEPGKKLSKQNHAKPVSHDNCRQTLVDVLDFLAMPVFSELALEPVENILGWAQNHWNVEKLPKIAEKLFI